MECMQNEDGTASGQLHWHGRLPYKSESMTGYTKNGHLALG